MALSLGFGVLVDLDHFVDYWYSEGRVCFDWKTFMATRYWRKSGRLFILFHAFEYLPFVFLAWQALKGRRWAVAARSAVKVRRSSIVFPPLSILLDYWQS